ncbi:type IX secretion system PorP/SprF family membrane protein [Anseongella ginsenosidimutans]|uniref:Type IX secretion system PorP/SprF family membrane protein n=1 Tax=Anseongella ginsenosidimutans TaxID=496056 RepID=A0A4R3KQT4_9SPHI|nr:type IX secretion system membrane protein PorP/SprF [Anseongella ginsenosidimutans]QEC52898.1 type IX secretion system membrane protein PorP/SprF [Anseongella ginsenosidimutans]TCS87288.1 type IX secretion system PorP/SprF family membrane protein [Anseongella ginsenosidimutans]
MKRKIITRGACILVLLVSGGCWNRLHAQQDAQFSQYIFNHIYINPAYAGYREETTIHAFFRSQWTGVPGAPQTASLAFDGTLNNKRIGLALQVAEDKLGAQHNRSAYGNYSYKIQTGYTSKLAFGLGVGFVQLGLDGKKMDPLDQGDVYIPENMQTSIIFDSRAGVLFSDEYFYAGFSVDNLLAMHLDGHKDRTLLTPTPQPHYYLTAGALFPFSDKFALRPSFLLKDDRGGPTSLDLNLFALLNERIWVGASYRTGVVLYDKSYLEYDPKKTNAVVGLAEFFISDQIRVGYAYDYSLNALKNYNYGTHELSVSYYIDNQRSYSERCYKF